MNYTIMNMVDKTVAAFAKQGLEIHQTELQLLVCFMAGYGYTEDQQDDYLTVILSSVTK
jgi:hypothetical protein